MKITICRKCEDSIVKVQPLGFNYTKDNTPSYLLACKHKKDSFGFDMECRYVRHCPKGNGGEKRKIITVSERSHRKIPARKHTKSCFLNYLEKKWVKED